MKPIISPWLIYFAELADSINMAFLFVTFIAFIIMAFAFIPYMDNKKDETLKQCLKKSFIWFCISVVITSDLSFTIFFKLSSAIQKESFPVTRAFL